MGDFSPTGLLLEAHCDFFIEMKEPKTLQHFGPIFVWDFFTFGPKKEV